MSPPRPRTGHGAAAGARTSTVRTALAGAVAGTAAVWAMDRVGWWMYHHEDPAALQRELATRPEGLDSAHLSARRLGRLVGRDPGTRQPNATGLTVHYGLGALPGAAYAVCAARYPALRRGAGVPYGVGLFLVNDELAAPLLGLARGPRHYPWQAHARGLVAHVVLGVVTDRLLEVTRRRRRAQCRPC